MILVDTSVWIDWFNGRAHPSTDKLDQLLDEPIQLVLCDRVVQEIVQGIHDDADAREVERKLSVFDCLDTGGRALALASAARYRQLRKLGVTIRSSNDVVIAELCIQHGIAVLHNDRDFDVIAKHTKLKLATW
jgi:predicted nucleic acid-binding protein